MKTIPYIACTSACLAAYLALAFVANRERLAWPMLYASWCAVICAVALVGVARPEFVGAFSRELLPIVLMGAGLFCFAELARHMQGVASAAEVFSSTALICGVGISLLGGEWLRPGYARLALQTAAVVVPIAIVLATLGARPLPEPVAAPVVAYAPVGGLPVPGVSQ